MTITTKAGSNLDLPIQILKDGIPLSLAGRTPVYLVKAAIIDDDVDAVLRFEVGGGLAVTDQANGWIKLTKTGAEMALEPKKYYGALQLVGPGAGEVIEIPDTEPFDVWVILKHVVQATA